MKNTTVGEPGLRIGHVLPSLETGGQEIFVARLCALHRKAGLQPRVISMTTGGPVARMLRDEGIPYAIAPRQPRLPGYPRGLIEVLGGMQVDVLHSHSGSWFPTAFAGRVLGVPLVHTEHGRYPSESWWVQWADRLAWSLTARLVVVSHVLRTDMASRLKSRGVPQVIPNGVIIPKQTERTTRIARRLALGATNGGPIIGTVGRLVEAKDHALFLRAVARLAPRHPQLHAVIIGDGPLATMLHEEAVRLGIRDCVSFLGYRNDAAVLMGALDVYVSSSITEGTPIAVLEAMAAGCAVVATEVGGIGHLLAGGEVGLLVEPRDDIALAEALNCLLIDPSLRAELGARARRRAESQFSLEVCGRRYAQIYAEVLEGRA